MKIEKEDVLTPANVATVLGLVLTLHGAANLDTLQGVIEVGAGRTLDLIDGPLARRFHASRLGAALDGAADKIAMLGLLVGAAHFEAAPLPVIGLVGLHNLANMALTLYSESHGKNPESSNAGKRSIFLENVGLGAFALANVMESPGVQTGLETAAYIAVAVGLAIGAGATSGYLAHARSNPE